ncbi:MAG: tRNA preQ1(34) S-adenosylmethionine ribosyltransferase-isomerase QueA, partial [Desulfosalsimonas sp.]
MNTGSEKAAAMGCHIKDFDYELPEDLIAQHPADRREASRLLVLDRHSGKTGHRRFGDLPLLLEPSDLLVVNDTRVVPVRLIGQKSTGGRAEVLLTDYAGGRTTGTGPYTFECECLIRASRAPGAGTELVFDSRLSGKVISAAGQGRYTVEFISDMPIEKVLEETGRVPLPPYIKRSGPEAEKDDREKYQTVYAAKNGAAAAPTAGFHFSRSLLDRIRKMGIQIAAVTLHVSYGTFMPVRVTDIRKHTMHTEHYEINQETAELINRAKLEKRRVIAVGTTSVRTLEYSSDQSGNIAPGRGACDLFIYPGYKFKAVDA